MQLVTGYCCAIYISVYGFVPFWQENMKAQCEIQQHMQVWNKHNYYWANHESVLHYSFKIPIAYWNKITPKSVFAQPRYFYQINVP